MFKKKLLTFTPSAIAKQPPTRNIILHGKVSFITLTF